MLLLVASCPTIAKDKLISITTEVVGTTDTTAEDTAAATSTAATAGSTVQLVSLPASTPAVAPPTHDSTTSMHPLAQTFLSNRLNCNWCPLFMEDCYHSLCSLP